MRAERRPALWRLGLLPGDPTQGVVDDVRDERLDRLVVLLVRRLVECGLLLPDKVSGPDLLFEFAGVLAWSERLLVLVQLVVVLVGGRAAFVGAVLACAQ